MSSLTTRAVEELEGVTAPRRAEGQEPVRARRAVVALRPADRRHGEVDPRQVRRAGDGRQPGRVPGRLELRRDVGADRRAGQGRAATSTSRPGTYRNVNGTEATALGLVAASIKSGLPLVFGAYPITPASDLLHALVAPAGHGRAHDPGRGRDRGGVDGAGRGVRRRAGRDVHVRPGAGSQDRDDRPGRDARAADGDHRRPARRPVDRHADQDRAVRPAAGAVRAPRRVAAAGARGLVARGSASRRSTRRCGSRSPTARR